MNLYSCILYSYTCLLQFYTDHNECLSGTHVCEQLCENSHGAYTCSCKNGYRLATANNRTCDGINTVNIMHLMLFDCYTIIRN